MAHTHCDSGLGQSAPSSRLCIHTAFETEIPMLKRKPEEAGKKGENHTLQREPFLKGSHWAGERTSQ